MERARAKGWSGEFIVMVLCSKENGHIDDNGRVQQDIEESL